MKTVNVRWYADDAKLVEELLTQRIDTIANWIDSALESNDIERAKRLSSDRRHLIEVVRSSVVRATRFAAAS